MNKKLLIWICIILLIIPIIFSSDEELLISHFGDNEAGSEISIGDNELGIGTTLGSYRSIAISSSNELFIGINWTIINLPTINQSAPGNNISTINDTTKYNIAISTIGTNVDMYIKANDDLIENIGGISRLGLGNETFSYNGSNSSVPSEQKFRLTTNYADNKIGSNLADNSYIYLKFFLNAPGNQPTGVYNNSILFKAVPTGELP